MKARIIHIEDEIRKNSGLWNYVHAAIAELLSDDELEKFSKSKEMEKRDGVLETRKFQFSWPQNKNEHDLEISSFSSAKFAEKFLEKQKDGICTFIILDTRYQKTNDDVLNENVHAVKMLVNNNRNNIRIFSAYYDTVLSEYSRKQDVAIDNVVVPPDWELPGDPRMTLQDIMIRKIDSEELVDVLLNWFHDIGLIELDEE